MHMNEFHNIGICDIYNEPWAAIQNNTSPKKISMAKFEIR
jgi:hypothetical protein